MFFRCSKIWNIYENTMYEHSEYKIYKMRKIYKIWLMESWYIIKQKMTRYFFILWCFSKKWNFGNVFLYGCILLLVTAWDTAVIRCYIYSVLHGSSDTRAFTALRSSSQQLASSKGSRRLLVAASARDKAMMDASAAAGAQRQAIIPPEVSPLIKGPTRVRDLHVYVYI